MGIMLSPSVVMATPVRFAVSTAVHMRPETARSIFSPEATLSINASYSSHISFTCLISVFLRPLYKRPHNFGIAAGMYNNFCSIVPGKQRLTELLYTCGKLRGHSDGSAEPVN